LEKEEAVRVVLSARKKAQITGGALLGGIILAGVMGWIFWKWYAFVIGIAAGLLINFSYSIWQVRQISRLTGLSPEQQEMLLKKHSEDAQ
jgi:putative flippase GtrA